MKNKFRFHLCLICMFVFAVAGCKVKRPSDVISESKMENLLYDYHVAKSMGDNLPYGEKTLERRTGTCWRPDSQA